MIINKDFEYIKTVFQSGRTNPDLAVHHGHLIAEYLRAMCVKYQN